MNPTNQNNQKVDSSLDNISESEPNFIENMKEIYKIAFEIFDIDKSHTIDKTEFMDLMRSLGYDFPQENIEDMMYEAIKTQKPDSVDFENLSSSQFQNFMNLWSKKRDVAEDYMEAFRVFDFTGNGKVELSTLGDILKSYGDNISDEEIDYMLNDADVNGDGYVDYRKFVRLLLNK